MPRRTVHSSITEDRVVAACMRALHELYDPGFCLACGACIDGVEPDATDYGCPWCAELAVYGAEQMMILQYYHPTPQPKDTDGREENKTD